MVEKLNSPQVRTLCQKNGISYLGLFGSHARGTATENSDVDLMVEFDEPIGYFGLAQIQRNLSEILDKKIDLVTMGSVSPRIYPYIKKDLVDIYGK